MKRSFFLLSIAVIVFFGWRYASDKPSEPNHQPNLTLWDIGFVPSLPPKEYTSPTIVSQSKDGINLEDFTPNNSKPFVLHFWAPWCSPCRSELPHFAQFAASHPDVQILCVADSAQTPQNIQSFYESQKILGLPIMIDTNNRLTQRMEVDGLPTTIFFDAQGKEKGRVVGAVHWNKKDVVELILKELLS